MFAKPKLERQEDNDTQSILVHQLLFTLHTRLEIQKHFKEKEEAAEINIQELIMTNKDSVKDQRIKIDNIANYISNCKIIINQSQKGKNKGKGKTKSKSTIKGKRKKKE